MTIIVILLLVELTNATQRTKEQNDAEFSDYQNRRRHGAIG